MQGKNGILCEARNVSHDFTQPNGKPLQVLQNVNVSTRERTPTIAAGPNPVPTGAGLGRTTISWTTLAKDVAEVYVSKDGGPEQLFARGPHGSIEAGWIATGSSYEFRLYSGDASRRLLARTIVTR